MNHYNNIALVITICVFSVLNCKQNKNDDTNNLAAIAALALNGGPVYMFSDSNGATGYDGNLGGRSGADSKCVTKKNASYASLSCTKIRAWISVSSSDSISNMPVTYGVPIAVPVLGPTGVQIASNWSGLLDGTVSDAGSLQKAGLFPSITTPYYWTGSSSNEGNASQTCKGWASALNTDKGESLDSTNNGGFFGTEQQNCDSKKTNGVGDPNSIVCICW